MRNAGMLLLALAAAGCSAPTSPKAVPFDALTRYDPEGEVGAPQLAAVKLERDGDVLRFSCVLHGEYINLQTGKHEPWPDPSGVRWQLRLALDTWGDFGARLGNWDWSFGYEGMPTYERKNNRIVVTIPRAYVLDDGSAFAYRVTSWGETFGAYTYEGVVDGAAVSRPRSGSTMPAEAISARNSDTE